MSESVSEWVIISDLPNISNCWLSYSPNLLTYLIPVIWSLPVNWSLPSQLVPSQSTGTFPVNWSLPASPVSQPVHWTESSPVSSSASPVRTYLLTCSPCSPNNTIITIIWQFYCFTRMVGLAGLISWLGRDQLTGKGPVDWEGISWLGRSWLRNSLESQFLFRIWPLQKQRYHKSKIQHVDLIWIDLETLISFWISNC